MKRCKSCGEVQPVADFYEASGTRDGLRGQCKACDGARHRAWYRANRERAIANVKRWRQANAERHNAYQRQYRADHTQQFRDGHRRRVFDLTGEQYRALLDVQNGRCALCGGAPRADRSLHVDHNHQTGSVRGLLCFRCNVGIGQFGEDPLRIARAIVYLARGRAALDADPSAPELFVERVCELLGSGHGPDLTGITARRPTSSRHPIRTGKTGAIRVRNDARISDRSGRPGAPG